VSRQDGEVVGVYWLRRLNNITWEIHTNVRLKHWGTGLALPHAKASLRFIFEESGAKKIVANIPLSSKPVLDYAEAVGFRREGVRQDSFQLDGTVYDEIYLGIKLDEINS
jgi:RimJ/RimL family protein N-acetyltransferase